MSLTGRIWSVSVLIFSSALAQNAGQIVRQQDLILNQEATREKLLQRELEDRRPPSEIKKSAEKSSSSANQRRVTFHEIIFENVTLFSAEKLQKITASFLNRPLCIQEINDILKAVTELYVSEGYVTARVYIKPQNLNSGKLALIVFEGKLESLDVIRNGKVDDRPHKGIPATLGDFLNLRDLEQGVDQISRLSTYDVQMSMEPGQEEGASRVVVTTQQDKPGGITLSKDNYGNKSTGANQGTLQMFLDDPVGLYDTWMVTGLSNLSGEHKDRFARSITLQNAIPMGYWTFRYFFSYFNYLSTVTGQLQEFHFSGNTRSHKVELERILYRDGDSKLGLGVFMASRATRNYIENVLVEVSSQKQTPLGVRFFDTRRLLGMSLSTALTFSLGTRWLGAQPEKFGPMGPNPRFTKWGLDVAIIRPFTVKAESFYLWVRGYGQYSRDILFSNERIGFGNAQTVRGFLDGGMTGDTGLYVSNDLGWTFLKPRHEGLKKILGEGAVFVGYDFGAIRGSRKKGVLGGTISSVTAGFRNQGGVGTMELCVSRALSQPSFVKKEGTVIHLRFNVNF